MNMVNTINHVLLLNMQSSQTLSWVTQPIWSMVGMFPGEKGNPSVHCVQRMAQLLQRMRTCRQWQAPVCPVLNLPPNMICAQHAKLNMESHSSLCCGICFTPAERREKALKCKEEKSTVIEKWELWGSPCCLPLSSSWKLWLTFYYEVDKKLWLTFIQSYICYIRFQNDCCHVSYPVYH